jgi:DNA-directed RNA polymerase subunit F
MVKKILKEELISIPEVKEIMEKLFEKMEKIESIQPDPFQDATYEYVHNFSKMSADVAKNVIKMLVKDYSMDIEYAIQVVNIDPNYHQEMRVILEKDVTLRDLSDDDLKIMIQKIRDLQA